MPNTHATDSHGAIHGLPNSLVALDGHTFAVITLMTRLAGLNRERRREMQGEAKAHREDSEFAARILSGKVAKSELSVLTHYLSPIKRFRAFWHCAKAMQERRSAQGGRSWAIAVDIQLLGAYAPDWSQLELDEDALTLACPEWPQIKADVESVEKGPLPLGVFMLWPRIAEELGNWDYCEEPQQQRIAHAVFALSSVGFTDWFIRTGLSICPGLTTELGPLVKPAPRDSESASTPEDDGSSPVVEPVEDDDASGVEQDWVSLLLRLEDLVAELKNQPTRDVITDLEAVVRDLARHQEDLPHREQPQAQRLEDCLAGLMTHLQALAARDGFNWLDGDLLTQIEARWRLSMRERAAPDQLEALAEDAGVAIQRSEALASELVRAISELSDSGRAVTEAEEQLAAGKGFAEQAAAKRKRTEALKLQLDAEARQQSHQEQLLDAVSPYAEPFDYTFDYSAMLAGPAAQDVPAEPAEPAELDTSSELPAPPQDSPPEQLADQPPVHSPSQAAPPESSAQPAEASSLEEPPSAVHADTAEEAAQVFLQVPDRSPPPTESVEEATAPANNAPQATETQLYGDEAGEACRPIWRLLSCGQPALALQAANWTAETNPDIRVPPTDLLAAVALEGALLMPDGGIHSALSARFERLLPADFAAQSPRTWHAAVNLLLASATMRAMVIAPGTGASSVAAYLHQDGNYPALYALVQRLRELSPLLMNFRVEPAVLRQARSEAAIRADLDAVQREAEDWLRVQAPAYTIKFAAATNVWRHWIHAGGQIDALVTPIVHNRITEADRVREQLAAMSDHDHLLRLIHDTDRKKLKRRRGEDIHAGALDHLLRNVEDALRLPRQWLSLVELLGRQGDRMRDLLEQVRKALQDSQHAVMDELQKIPQHDPWGLVQAGQAQALSTLRGVLGLFDTDADLPSSEPTPTEWLGLPLLLVSDLAIREDWTIESSPSNALTSLNHWLDTPVMEQTAAAQRLERGDVLGAELLVEAGLVDQQTLTLRQERERWKLTLRKEVAECRRSVEVGSAYGYLGDADRGQFESQFARLEARVDEDRRFDLAMTEIRTIRTQVDQAREVQARLVLDELKHVSITPELAPTKAEVEQAINDGDLATARELVHWLAQGRPVATELDGEPREGFDRFFPTTMQTIESWLETQRRDAIEQVIRSGQTIPGMDAQRVAGAQREQAAKMFSAWTDMKAHQSADQSRLQPLLTGLGLTVKSLNRTEKVTGREVWLLDSQSIEDRHICAVPMFGSAANGKYRVVCAWGRPTEDELLQWVGDSTVSRPTFLLYFGRMTERKWRDLSRLAKTKRRSFTLLDETLLVYLCGAAGSRLRTWFDVSLPFSFSSPYDATAGLVPPEMFYGRGAELDAVRGPNGRCFIYGGRQLGKTALLKRAEQSFHSPASGHYAKWIDLRAEGIGVSRAASEVWITLYEKLRELGVLNAGTADPAQGRRQSVDDSVVRGIRDFLTNDSDRRLLLLLDEADRFFEQDGRNDFKDTRRLKQLMDETGRRFKVVFAGLHNVLRMTERPNHPLAHFGEPIEIGPLREGEEVREAADLIRLPMAAAGFEFESRALVIRILAQTNYYPSLIQLYCSHLLRHMLSQISNRQRTGGPRYVVTDRDIEQVYSSDALRDEIRAKFRLTLQLDPRYEVVAYALALDLLRNRYSQSDGLSWQTIRQAGAMHWWPQGFRDTSEIDFRVLLDEMVGLGVLRRLPAGHYVLRNPNVLLLLGNQEEIESVLVKDREPAVEFESASFRPLLQRKALAPGHSVFTYQQLSRLHRRENGITVVTGTPATGIGDVVSCLQGYRVRDPLGREAPPPVVLEGCTDRLSFGDALSDALADREKDVVTPFVIPHTTPWSDLWITEAKHRLDRLKSERQFASLIFVAEPAALWRLLGKIPDTGNGPPPWMSLLHWRDEFLRHWLDERQLQLEAEDRRRLVQLTGGWPSLLLELVGDCTDLRRLRERISRGHERVFGDAHVVARWREQLGLTVSEPVQTLDLLARLGEPVEVQELAAVGELAVDHVQTSLRWGELLGLTHTEGADFWTVDPIAVRALTSVQA